jgi:AraC-like DNA-binding protein
MIILRSPNLPSPRAEGDLSPLNAVWAGQVKQSTPLPRLGHLVFVCPLNDAPIACAGTRIPPDRYLLLSAAPAGEAAALENLHPRQELARLLLLFVGPGFVAQMAHFLDIPPDMERLLHGVPLPKGDALSHLMNELAAVLERESDHKLAEELFIEVVGQVLRWLRLQQQALLKLAGRKQTTIDELLALLLQARQYIEAHCLTPLKTADVARQVGLSEYHFARLFKTAFGVTVHQFVLRLRLDEARHRLALTDSPVTEIALAVGYNSLSAFIHAFRRQFNLTPSAYRTRFESQN